MSSLRAPGLGPIVGHTTDRTCRLWIATLTVDRPNHRLIVEVLGRDGRPITSRGPLRRPVDLTSSLDLAPW